MNYCNFLKLLPATVMRNCLNSNCVTSRGAGSRGLCFVVGLYVVHKYPLWHFHCMRLANPKFYLENIGKQDRRPAYLKQELIRRLDSERELFLQHRTCRGQRLRPLNEFVVSTKHLRYLPTIQTDF